MSFYNAELHCMMSGTGPHSVSSAGVTNASTSAPATSGDGESFFHHVLDVINPLQHLPVVGTLYRAITGDHIGPIEKIAGDGLYGGIIGAATAAADVAFEAVTGKSVEDTVLAWFKPDSNIAVANSKVAAPKIAFNTVSLPSGATPALPGDIAVASAQPNSTSALLASMNAQGLSGDMAMRALAAYQRSTTAAPAPVVASLN